VIARRTHMTHGVCDKHRFGSERWQFRLAVSFRRADTHCCPPPPKAHNDSNSAPCGLGRRRRFRQSQPSQLTKEEEQKKQEELRKKVKESLDGAVSDAALLKNLENKVSLQARIACLLWNYDEKGARSMLNRSNKAYHNDQRRN
jgi:hypothetical protein